MHGGYYSTDRTEDWTETAWLGKKLTAISICSPVLPLSCVTLPSTLTRVFWKMLNKGYTGTKTPSLTWQGMLSNWLCSKLQLSSEKHMIINPLGLFLQMTIAIKKLFGILRRRPKPAQAGSVVAHLSVLWATDINLWGLQPQIILNSFFRLTAVRIQRILQKCRFCIYCWLRDYFF